MPFGAAVTTDGVLFRLWAPHCSGVDLKLDTPVNIQRMRFVGDGWHEHHSAEAGSGTRYQFLLPDGIAIPDPASRFQPEDVHGPSEVIDPADYKWTDYDWRGRAWEELVIYELHVGAFSSEGTFRGAIEHLDHLRSLGVTAIELMPVGDFTGRRNWGYDGVLLFAPDSSYGRPEDLKALIEAAHQRGIAVLLDVVYNHFGPDGNFLPLYCPIFTDAHRTPWGAAINFDAAQANEVRNLIVNNALYWIVEYNLDGLRLDAVHALIDESPTHILQQISDAVRHAAGDRQVHLVLENEENQSSWLCRGPATGTPLAFTAQWNDDVHHVLHTAATGERAGYYEDYLGDSEKLGRALAEGFAFQGQMMPYRGHARGEPSAELPPTAFIAFLQNHDQVGNRAYGDRITTLAPAEAVRAVTSIYLLAPQIPMLFMGEEWGATQPFPFFCDFQGDLAEAVRNGRRAEFAKFPEFQDPRQRERIPDPLSEQTFNTAKLRWIDAATAPHADWQEWYARILSVRHSEIVPRLRGISGHAGRFEVIGDMAVVVRWTLGDTSELSLAANLKSTPISAQLRDRRVLWSEGSTDKELGAWSILWALS
jgi:maltooligosyltrehalose trehalohydrolase